jgi:hypothetical protein
MNQADFRFSVDLSRLDRGALLDEAASKMDVAVGHLGPAGRAAESDAGKLTRAIKHDQARLPAANPDLYRITDKDFLARNLAAPVRFTELSKDFNFYWMDIPVGLHPEWNWAFNMIEARIAFNEGDAPETLPKAYQILPAKQFQTLAQANMNLEVRLNENFEFEATSGKLGVASGDASIKAKADAAGVVKAGAGAVLGPFKYQIKKAKIDHNAPGMEWVFWRIDGAEFFQEDSPRLIVILQVPKRTKTLRVSAALQAYRYFNLGAANWQEAVKRLPELLKSYFESGAPLQDSQQWDLSASL